MIPQAAPPISYSRQIAPVLAMRCSSCHGEAGGLGTRSYSELMRGGDLGKVIVPGDPERSLLVHFIDGRRGPEHRMPLGGAPLDAEQVAAIRRWIAEGAKEDPGGADPTYRFALPKVRSARTMRIFCRVPTAGYLTLTVLDPRKRRTLFTEVATLKQPREQGDAGVPGDLLSWEIHAARGWPKWVEIEVTVAYPDQEPKGVELYVKN